MPLRWSSVYFSIVNPTKMPSRWDFNKFPDGKIQPCRGDSLVATIITIKCRALAWRQIGSIKYYNELLNPVWAAFC